MARKKTSKTGRTKKRKPTLRKIKKLEATKPLTVTMGSGGQRPIES